MSALPSTLQRLRLIVALGRPLHLLGGLLFFSLGTVIAAYSGYPTRWPMAFGGLLTVWTMQLMTHYSNEYFDFEADQANSAPTDWSGGSRVLVGGQVAPAVALGLALSFAALAVGASVTLALSSAMPWQTALLLALAMALAWSYSSPPLTLNWRAMGELTGAVLVPGLTALVGFQLQAATLTMLPALAIVPLCCFQFAMLVAVNYPDARSDAAVGKTTLVVLLGARRAARLHLAALALPYLALPVLVGAGLPLLVAGLMLGAAPIAAWLAWRIAHGGWAEPAVWNQLGFWSIGLLMATGMLALAGFLISMLG